MRSPEPYEEKMPFGKHQGKTLGKLGSTDDGLKYLIWLHKCGVKSNHFQKILDAYIASQDTKNKITDLSRRTQ